MNRSFHRIALATLVLCAATGASAQDKTLRLLTWGGYAPKEVVEQFTKALVVAIEEYGKRKVGRRRKAAAAPGAVF